MTMTIRQATAEQAHHPRYVVWELTLKCDLACRHCGSRAGKARPRELTLAEALGVVEQLARLGAAEITFIGGEAYLYPHWLDVIAAAHQAGIRCTLTTGGRALDRATLERAQAAGLLAVSVSIDGLAATHDRLRAVPGSWRAAMQTLTDIAAAGMLPLANTQFNRCNLPEVEALYEVLVAQGIRAWQVQLTGPMGRAADQPDWLLQPWQMLDLVPRLARLATAGQAQGVRVHAANNLGYFGPYEAILRAAPWAGCAAGRYVLGIEADGAIKGCPSLPSAPYVGGNILETPLEDIWAHAESLAFTRTSRVEELWGFCAGCYYAPVCQGGCSWTAHTLLGRRGNMPYCFHRAETLQQQGRRERIAPETAAPGLPFDFGRYQLIEEPWPPLQA